MSDAPVAEALRGLAEMTGENVIFSSHVKERVTASLDDVTPEEAMTSIMAARGLAGRKEGSTLIIFSAVTEKESGIFAKSYRLSYANAKEAAETLVGHPLGVSHRLGSPRTACCCPLPTSSPSAVW